jgi:copper chaperone CopZ
LYDIAIFAFDIILTTSVIVYFNSFYSKTFTMSTIRIFIAFICVFAVTSVARAQNAKLDGPFLKKKVIKVYGACDECKGRIERTARRTPGVTYAHWDPDTQKLLVEYNRTKTNPGKIQQAVAAGGHDTEAHKATGLVSTDSSGCCHHRAGPGQTGGDRTGGK